MSGMDRVNPNYRAAAAEAELQGMWGGAHFSAEQHARQAMERTYMEAGTDEGFPGHFQAGGFTFGQGVQLMPGVAGTEQAPDLDVTD